jgi:3-methyl-2-oxobutanoate hydroxymethyltransferase
MKEVRDHAVQSYGEAVREGNFPDSEAESYSMDKTEWARFIETEISEGETRS